MVIKVKYCPICNKQISRDATYCHRCCELGERNYMFGKHSWNYQGSLNYCCMDCGGIISKPTALKGQGRCRSCSRSGKLSWNAKIGLLHRGEKSHSWKGGLPHCVDCGKILSFYSCKRCKKCNAKFYAPFGKNNRMFGKKPKFYRFFYKGIKFRSSWEVLVAIWFDWSNIKWKYENKTFNLGNCSYTPDFYLPEFDCYVEIKGWWKNNFLEKLTKVKKKINIHVWKEEELYEFLGVSKFLLTKARKTWLNNYLIQKGNHNVKHSSTLQ